MFSSKQHLFLYVTSILLIGALLLPSVAKFTHIFNQHHHEVCDGEAIAHFHTLDVDCEFYKFQLNSAFTFPDNPFVIVEYPKIKSIIKIEYGFLSEFQQLHFSLRGPPELI